MSKEASLSAGLIFQSIIMNDNWLSKRERDEDSLRYQFVIKYMSSLEWVALASICLGYANEEVDESSL